METKHIAAGMAVQVVRGYSRRPATVVRVNTNGTVAVHFTDTKGLPRPVHAAYFYGATVRPNQIHPAKV